MHIHDMIYQLFNEFFFMYNCHSNTACEVKFIIKLLHENKKWTNGQWELELVGRASESPMAAITSFLYEGKAVLSGSQAGC